MPYIVVNLLSEPWYMVIVNKEPIGLNQPSHRFNAFHTAFITVVSLKVFLKSHHIFRTCGITEKRDVTVSGNNPFRYFQPFFYLLVLMRMFFNKIKLIIITFANDYYRTMMIKPKVNTGKVVFHRN